MNSDRVDPRDGLCVDQRNGFPQKKQNRLSEFTIVPQCGQRFFCGAAWIVGAGMAGVLAGLTNSMGGGLAARGST